MDNTTQPILRPSQTTAAATPSPSSSSSSTHLKPPTASHQRRSPSPHRTTASPTPSAPRPPVTIHPTATVAESILLQGTYQISIGATTIVHPRARMYTYEGPIVIGEGCIIGEKSVIGTVPGETNSSSSSSSSTAAAAVSSKPMPSGTTTGPTETSTTPITTTPSSSSPKTIRLSTAVTIAPLSTILPGVQIHSASTIDPLVTINRNADIGGHSKICSGCQIPENGVVGEWTVVWGAGTGFGQRRRKKAVGAMGISPHVVGTQKQEQERGDGRNTLEGRVVEDARLVVLSREREALAKMIGAAPVGSGRR